METPESSDIPFDFSNHRIKAVQEYQKVRQLYEKFSDVIKGVLRDALYNAGIKVASVEARAKSPDSFANKAAESSPDNPNQPKYKEPLKDISDLAGIRIITFFPRTIDEVDKIIYSEFEVLEKSDMADELKKEERFGYQSVHYLISLKPNRFSLPEYHPYEGLIAEVQVRTILQHAWAEIEHDIQYKSVETIPSSIHRRFSSLAGLIEIADREFQAVQDADEKLKKEARESVKEGRFETVEITPDALKVYLDNKLGPDGRMTDYSYDYTARLLLKQGFSNFRQIDECISEFDDDHLSKLIWGYRQGQLTRFEIQLLAGMGEHFINMHFWGNEDWFRKYRTGYLDALRQADIKIGNYKPSSEEKTKES